MKDDPKKNIQSQFRFSNWIQTFINHTWIRGNRFELKYLSSTFNLRPNKTRDDDSSHNPKWIDYSKPIWTHSKLRRFLWPIKWLVQHEPNSIPHFIGLGCEFKKTIITNQTLDMSSSNFELNIHKYMKTKIIRKTKGNPRLIYSFCHITCSS